MVISPNKRHMEQMARETARALTSDTSEPMTEPVNEEASRPVPAADEG
jgi:uncharacterized NAD-dependent epimerase/dehydratase family protein